MGIAEEKISFINNTERQYIINLQKNRSLIAMLASIVSLCFAIYAIVAGLLLYQRNGLAPVDLFQFFTIDANVLTALGVAMIIPYAIDGFRKNRFYCPKWVVFFYYSGVVCTTLTMLFAVCVVSFVDTQAAFFGYNFYLHIICPIMILILFFTIESYYKISLKVSLFSLLPFFIYTLVYTYKVIIVGADSGGWEDIYYFAKFAHPVFSFFAMLLIAFAVAVLVGFIYNKISAFRIKKFVSHLWNENVSDVEIKIELFGLGRFMGKKENKSYATLPLDIIYIFADKYHIKHEELINVYTKGLIDGINKK